MRHLLASILAHLFSAVTFAGAPLLAFFLVWALGAQAYPPHPPGMGGHAASGNPPPTITGIALSGNSFAGPGTDGTVVGAITVSGSNNSAETLSITGTDAAKFRLSATTGTSANLLVSGTQCPTPPATYSISIVATLAGATGSPFTQPETISCTGGLAAGFYVSPSGTVNSTCSITVPCTFAAAQTAMRNSSTVKLTYVRGGFYNAQAYPQQYVCILDFTSSDDNTTWQYYPPDGYNSADMDGGPDRTLGSANTNQEDAFCFSHASNMVINGLKFTNFKSDPAWISDAPGIKFINNIVDTTYHAYIHSAIWLDNVPGGLIDHNAVLNSENIGIGQGPGSNSGWTNLTISNNFIYNSARNFADSGCIYGQDFNAVRSTNIRIINNYIRDCHPFAGPEPDGDPNSGGVGGRCIYLDTFEGNTTMNGNICSGRFGECLFNHADQNLYDNNICDLWNQGDQWIVVDQQWTGGGNMLGDTARHNIVISKNGGGGNGYTDNGVAPPNPMTIGNNMYHNYGSGGNLNHSGSPCCQDSSPVNADPLFLTCPSSATSWNYVLNGSSPAFNSPTSFVDITRTWGPPGYVVPKVGTPPSYGPTC